MGMPIEKVELGFDLSVSGSGPFLTLDDPIAGQLDNPDWILAGTIFYDVTSRVRRFSLSRGRSSQFDFNPAGYAQIEFNNHDRAFDPLYSGSPFYGNIVPKREIRIYSDNKVQFTGSVEDWNLTYLPNGDSIAAAECVDATSVLATQVLSETTPTSQLSGARINAILSNASVNWSTSLRDIDPGGTLLGDQVIPEGQNVLQYLQTIAKTEPGEFFVNKQGEIAFRDKNFLPTADKLVVFGGTAVDFVGVQVVYGSEQLYNEVIVTRLGGGTAVAADLVSQNAYGIRSLTQSDLLMATDLDALDLAVSLADKFSTPEYRMDVLEVQVNSLEEEERAKVLNLEIGDTCKIVFTPNNIGDPIEQFIQIIRIQHTVDPENHFIEFGFRETAAGVALVLDDPEFGKLDSGYFLSGPYNAWTLNDPIYGRLSAGMALS